MTSNHEPGENDQRWAIVRDGTEHTPDVKYLSTDQEWGTIETAMFDSEDDASNGAETLCPAFMSGHAEPVALN